MKADIQSILYSLSLLGFVILIYLFLPKVTPEVACFKKCHVDDAAYIPAFIPKIRESIVLTEADSIKCVDHPWNICMINCRNLTVNDTSYCTEENKSE